MANPVVLALGDIVAQFPPVGDATSLARAYAVSGLIATTPHDAILGLGDISNDDGTTSDYVTVADVLDPIKAKFRPAPGNHDYITPGAAPYYAYFGSQAGVAGKGWYSFDLGNNWHVIALNSEVATDSASEQGIWLAADLAASRGKHIMAFWHEPVVSSGWGVPGVKEQNWKTVGSFWHQLYNANAELILTGHEHIYERFARQDWLGNADSRGIRQFTAGTGGAGPFGHSFVARNSEKLQTLSSAGGAPFGCLRLELGPDFYSWSFVNTPSTTSFADSGTTPTKSAAPPPVVSSPTAIEAWVTEPDGTYITHLDRSTANPFRRFGMSAEINGTGVGSLEYHLANELVGQHDDLFAYGNLVWFRYRSKTRTWIVEERVTVLDESEQGSDWVRVAGRGVLQLVGDRTIWPTHYDDVNTDPAQWELGGWVTKTDASAAVGQKVVPVTSTTVGAGATVGDPVEIVGGGHRQIGIIASIVAGVSVTLEDNLAYTFPTGSRIRSAATQWRRFVNRAAGEMLWDVISESNPRFATQIVRGTVETTGADGWTQDFRFDNALDVVKAVTNVYGDVEMDGLTFNYRNAMGVDRSTSVVLEEGADIVGLDVNDSDRDSLSWVVAEGTGHAVFSYLAPKKKLTRAQRKTAARLRKLHRKAPAAPRKVIQVKADYDIDLASEAVGIARRREAFLDAKDVSDPIQLDALADAALEDHQINEAVGLEVIETRYKVDTDYGLGDWVRGIVPSRGFDEDVRIVAITFREDDSEQIRIAIDVNTARQDRLLKLAAGAKQTRASLGVVNRQPQGQLVPFSFSGADVFDTTDTMDVFLYVPDRMYRCIEAKVLVRFREFFAAAKSAVSSGSLTSDSGGGSTSGSSSASSSGSSSASSSGSSSASTSGVANAFLFIESSSHSHGGGPVATANFQGMVAFDTADHSHGISHTHGIPHTHGIAHDHTTPNHQHSVPGHTHALVYGVLKEAYPGSHSVTLKVYELEAGAWVLRATIAALTADIEDVDLTPYITGPGNWRLELKSDAAQPNGGRLGCDVSGYVLGAIQSA